MCDMLVACDMHVPCMCFTCPAHAGTHVHSTLGCVNVEHVCIMYVCVLCMCVCVSWCNLSMIEMAYLAAVLLLSSDVLFNFSVLKVIHTTIAYIINMIIMNFGSTD